MIVKVTSLKASNRRSVVGWLVRRFGFLSCPSGYQNLEIASRFKRTMNLQLIFPPFY